MTTNFAGDFAVSKLGRLLDFLAVPARRHSEIIEWYWRESRRWIAESQAEFDNVARLRLREKFWQWEWFKPLPSLVSPPTLEEIEANIAKSQCPKWVTMLVCTTV